MKLKTVKRSAERKSELTDLRLKGMIPAVVYHQGKPAHPIAVPTADYEAIVRQVKQGHLSVTKITLIDEDGKEKVAILKEIQYHPTTYKVLHLDFEELDANVPVKVKIPLECIGMADCAGIKLGGSLRQVFRKILVKCLPKDIPSVFNLDVQAMDVNDKKHVSDIVLPKAVQLLVKPKEVAIVIAKR